MENNEITMFMEVKLDIHNKRPESLKFKQWSKCEVKIEGIKCLPSYLRVTITGCKEDGDDNYDALKDTEQKQRRSEEKRCICVSVIVPGVSISLATSRTKQFSYGLFWTQYRKQCFIYFSLETEISCRRHMKWIKKTIKNLELHRQLMLEQNRISRGPNLGVAADFITQIEKENVEKPEEDENTNKSPCCALGPLPETPYWHDCNQSGFSQRVSHISEIYEEIIEYVGGQPRLSRRVSRDSIASGIYEEMKPTSPREFNAIDEESTDFLGSCTKSNTSGQTPPPLPPLPPIRKRINTFDGQGVLGEIPRSNTNPESDLAKKKKYKNVLDIIFGNGRAKRAESVSETQACTADDIINSITPTKSCKGNEVAAPIYANESLAATADVDVKAEVNRQMKSICVAAVLANAKRNSFSSPDLSKINYLDDGAAFNYSLSPSDELNLSDESLSNVGISTIFKESDNVPSLFGKIATDRLNISEKLPNNFNFSAINSSSINLIGFNGAAIPASNKNLKKNKILIDDLTGYCVMAPIQRKKVEQIAADKTPAEPISSGYSTGSYPSTSSSTADDPKALNHTEELAASGTAAAATTTVTTAAEESAIYEQMLSFRTSAVESDSDGNKSTTKQVEDSPIALAYSASTNMNDFTGNLYENLLAVKASQELEQQLPPSSLSTSTPTESPLTQPTTVGHNDGKQALANGEEEDYYQTPRKSIISVDEKIPSYYPNSCDTAKTRRHHNMAVTGSPQRAIYNDSPTVGISGGVCVPTAVMAANATEKCNSASSTSVGLRHLVTLKIRRELKENLYISSPQSIIEQRQNGGKRASQTGSKNSMLKMDKSQYSASKSRGSGALKISEHVYTVKHAKQKNNAVDRNLSNNNNNNNNNETGASNLGYNVRERLHTELLHFALLQKIDFKFDDANSDVVVADGHKKSPSQDLRTPSPAARRQQPVLENEHIYENLLQPQQLQLPQTQKSITPSAESEANTNTKVVMHHSCTAVGMRAVVEDKFSADAEAVEEDVTDNCNTAALANGLSSVKKFAPLPRFKKIDFSPLRLRINNVLQRGQQQDF